MLRGGGSSLRPAAALALLFLHVRQPLPEQQALHAPQLYRITLLPHPGKNLHCCLLLNSHWRGQSAAHALAQAATGFAHEDPTTPDRKGRGSYSQAPRTTQDTQLHLRARWVEGALADISSIIISRERSYLMPLALSNTSTPGDNRQPGSCSSHTPSWLSLPQPSKQTPEKHAKHPAWSHRGHKP